MCLQPHRIQWKGRLQFDRMCLGPGHMTVVAQMCTQVCLKLKHFYFSDLIRVKRSTPRMCIDHVNIITNKWPKFIVVTYYDQTCLCADWQWDERFTPCASVAQTVCTHAPYFIPPVSPSAFIQCQQIQPSLVSYIPYWHLYNTCHITFTLHAYDLTSMSGCAAGGGGVIAGQLPSHG